MVSKILASGALLLVVVVVMLFWLSGLVVGMMIKRMRLEGFGSGGGASLGL